MIYSGSKRDLLLDLDSRVAAIFQSLFEDKYRVKV